MWNPATAFLWEWWRTTRRQVLFFVALGGISGWVLLSRASAADMQYAVFLLLVLVATFAWLAMLARSARNGFPMTLAYARPVRTRLLVAVPMAYLALACAATYAGPAMAFRLAFGAPFPVLPVAVLLAAGAVLFAACNWFTRAMVARFVASIVLLNGLGPALRWLDPWNVPPDAAFPPPLSSLALDFVDYAAIAVAAAVAYVATVYCVERQRRGDSETARDRRGPAAADRIAKRGIVGQVRDVVIAMRVRCPTSSPLAAELWIEATARGLPVLAIGAVSALAMPMIFMVGSRSLGAIALAWVGFAVAMPFFVGISASFWNRESSLRAPMSAFESARPLSTARLLAVQVGVAVAAMLAAWCLIAASAWWSPLYGYLIGYESLKSALAGAIAAASYANLAAGLFAALVAFISIVALLAAIRALSVLYGVRLWLGMLAVLAYLLLVALALAQEWVSAGVGAAVLGAHYWAVAVAIPLATLWVVLRALADGSLLPTHAGILAVATALFVAALAFLGHGGEALDGWAPAVAAAALASLLLPLTSGALAAWSLGRMRHA